MTSPAIHYILANLVLKYGANCLNCLDLIRVSVLVQSLDLYRVGVVPYPWVLGRVLLRPFLIIDLLINKRTK